MDDLMAPGRDPRPAPAAPTPGGGPGDTGPGVTGPGVTGPGDTGAGDGGLGRRAVAGVLWTASHKWVARITGLVTVALLTRLLTPADFGVVAVALSLLPMVQLLADVGFSTYIVQADAPSARTYSTAFWYSAVAGLALCVLLIAAAPLVGTLLADPDVVPAIRGLAPAAVLVTLGSVPMALLQRGMRFRALALQGVTAALLSQVVAVVLALRGAGVWALIGQTLAFQLVATALAWRSARWHPGLEFSLADLRALVRFGVHVVGVEWAALGRIWLENAIVVVVLGVSGLGYLTIAQRLIQLANDLTTTALVPVGVVVFAKIRTAPDRLRSAYLRAQGLAQAVVVPAMVFIAVAAPLLIPLFFGPQWNASIAPAQVYAVAAVFALGAIDQGLLYGMGRPGVWLRYALVVDAVTVAVTYAVAPRGLVAIATGFLGVAVAACAARWFLLARELRTHWWRIATPLARVSVAAAAAAAGGLLARAALQSAPALLALAGIAAAVAAAYLPVVRLTLRPAWVQVTDPARQWLTRHRAPRGSGGAAARPTRLRAGRR